MIIRVSPDMPPPRRLAAFLTPPAARRPFMVLYLLHRVVYTIYIVEVVHPLACIVESALV